MKESYCFCPACGINDDHWTFVEGITYRCDNCEHEFEDLSAAWWFPKMQDEFWQKFWDAYSA